MIRPFYIAGILTDTFNRPLRNAIIGLNHIIGVNGTWTTIYQTFGHHPIPIYNNPHTTTNENGGFVIAGGIDVANVGGTPTYQLNVMGDGLGLRFGLQRVRGRLITVVRMRDVAGGAFPDVTNLEMGEYTGIAMDVYTAVRNIRLPGIGMFLQNRPLTTEMHGFMGMSVITVNPY